MPSRKPHSKSRRGCESCKQRRVKCDEQGWPDGPCAACVIRKTECVYRSASLTTKRAGSETLPARRPSQSKPTSSSLRSGHGETEHDQDTSLPSSQDAIISSRSERSSVPNGMVDLKPTAVIPSISWTDRTKELELMHFWSTRTLRSFYMGENARVKMWRETVVELIFKHEFLLDIAFALTSVHIATEEVDMNITSIHVSKALQYQNRAFTSFSKCLEDLSPENCTVVIVFTLLNMACSVVAGQLPTGHQDRAKTPLQSILTIYEAVSFIHEIVENYPSWLIGGPFEGISTFMKGSLPVTAIDFRRPWSQTDIDGIQTSMQRLRALTGRIAVEKHPTYSKAIAMLDHHFISSTEYGLGWLNLCGPAFVEDINQEEPVALMLLLHWGVLLKHMEAMWWTQYSGSRLVEHLSSTLQTRGSDQMWQDAITWCQTPMTHPPTED